MNKQIQIGGASLPLVLFIVFLVLKLIDSITWSWAWVTSPLWMSGGIFLLIFLFVIILAIDGLFN